MLCYLLLHDIFSSKNKRVETIWTEEMIELRKAIFFTLVLPNVCPLAGGRKHCDPNAGRFVRYQFTPAFLQLRQVGAT